MFDQSSTRSEQTVQMGQEAMKVLFKEPIKEAVKETLAEEGLTEGVKSEWSDRLGGEETVRAQVEPPEAMDDESSGTIRTVVIPAAVVLGVALALRRLSEGELEPENVAAKIRGEEASMEEDASKSTAESGRSQFAEDDAEEVNV